MARWRWTCVVVGAAGGVGARGGRPASTLTAVAEGTATIRVTATDPGGLTATQTFTVVGGRGAAFHRRDQPSRCNARPGRPLHGAARIDGLRTAAGLGGFAWTDPVLTAGVTLVHLWICGRPSLRRTRWRGGRSRGETDVAPAVGTPAGRPRQTTAPRSVLRYEDEQ